MVSIGRIGRSRRCRDSDRELGDIYDEGEPHHDEQDHSAPYGQAGRQPDERHLFLASDPAAALTERHDLGPICPLTIDSAEVATGRLGAVLRAPHREGLTRLGPQGPWLATDLAHARRVLTDARGFDFPSTVSRDPDMSASTAETRTGHHVYSPLVPAQVDRGSQTFLAEWQQALVGVETSPAQGAFDAMLLLRRPVARATCDAVLEGLSVWDRDLLADMVLDWIDALAPVISARRSPGRWSRARRREARARVELETALDPLLIELEIVETSSVMATMLAAGIQVPIAAGSWLLVFLAAHPARGSDPEEAVWESLRIAPPTWLTARVTTAPLRVAGQDLAAGELVMVSPLLLGRDLDLVPGTDADVDTFDPSRWRQDDVRPGAWLPFGAGAHACPGRSLGLRLLHDLATWADGVEVTLLDRVKIDQTRGIMPSPAHIAFSPRPTQ